MKKKYIITNNLEDIKIQYVSSCPLIVLALQTETNTTTSIFGGAYTSSDLNDPLFVSEGMGIGGHYDCWNFNFKSNL